MGNYDESHDRVYRIFVSSAFSLKHVRDIVLKAILATGNLPIMIDLKPAADDHANAVIEKAITDSDIFILIAGDKYGSTFVDLDGKTIGFTEWEYNISQKSDKLYSILLIEEKNSVDIKRDNYDRNNESERNEIANEERYHNFYSKLNRADPLKNYWTDETITNFGINVTAAIGKAAFHLQTKHPDMGLIPAKLEDNIKVLSKSIRNELRKEVHSEFNLFDELDDRCEDYKEVKKSVAEVIEHVLNSKISNGAIDLFFDSGSAVSYVAQTVGKIIQNITNHKGDEKIVNVYTNNALAYLHLWLKSGVSCSLYPKAAAEKPYGETRGVLSDYGFDEMKLPEYVCNTLDDDEQRKIDNIVNNFPKQEHKDLIIIAGLSGIKMSNDTTLVAHEGFQISKKVEASIEKYRGMHVGDYFSKLMKIALIRTRSPMIFCMNYEKFDYKIRVGKCHLIFKDKDEWCSFLANQPIALCIGYFLPQRDEVEAYVNKLNFQIVHDEKSTIKTAQAIMIANDKFVNMFNI